ncbi:MAG TPA: FAD-dependent oxidoreductase [Anaerolineaceae bacterium]|nr:FAD-dependent oxidoreductase [Anaerolineaceae bacterium]
MKEFEYIIIGGGMTGSAAEQGIRQIDPNGTTAIFSMETDPPYNRPPLSKGLWRGKPVDSIFRKVTNPASTLLLGKKIVKIDREKSQVVDQDEVAYGYHKLLLATGGTPRRLPFGGDEILYYRTLQDYRLLTEWAKEKEKFVIIGGGFIGSEIAAALRMHQKEVTMIFPEEGIAWRVFPPDLSAFVTDYYRKKGVTVIAGDEIVGMQNSDHQIALSTKNHGDIPVDGGVIAGIGITVNDQLAKEAGLQTDQGIVVNEYLQSSDPNIYAAGDVARFYNPIVAETLRVEHEDNANTMGITAGRNMAGATDAYTHLPMFYSDLFDLGYEAVGILDPRLETITDWVEPYRKGVIYYLKQSRVKGILLWNVWNKVNAARELIARSDTADPGKLKGALTDL